MLERLRSAIIADPWRTASVGLAVALVLVFVLFLMGGDAAEPEAVAASTTTTSTSQPEASTSTNAGVTPSTLAPVTIEPPPPGRTGGQLAVRIDNAPGARPQWGLGEAGILVEFPVEGGMTRLTAIIPMDLQGRMGPIRSLRPLDGDLLPALTRAIVSTGGQPFVMREVEAASLTSVVAGFSSLFPSVGNPDPYDTFVDLGLLRVTLQDLQRHAPGLQVGDLPVGGGDALTVEMPFPGVSFMFEEGTGYVRLDEGEPFLTLSTSGTDPQPLRHDTLVVMSVAERSAGYTDSNDVPVFDYDVVGSGNLLVFHDGLAHPGTWLRAALDDPYVFLDESGAEFGLPEGNVYLAFVTRDSQVGY